MCDFIKKQTYLPFKWLKNKVDKIIHQIDELKFSVDKFNYFHIPQKYFQFKLKNNYDLFVCLFIFALRLFNFLPLLN